MTTAGWVAYNEAYSIRFGMLDPTCYQFKFGPTKGNLELEPEIKLQLYSLFLHLGLVVFSYE